MIKSIIQGILLFLSIGTVSWLLTKLSYYLGFSPMSEMRAMIFFSIWTFICLFGLIFGLIFSLKFKKGV